MEESDRSRCSGCAPGGDFTGSDSDHSVSVPRSNRGSQLDVRLEKRGRLIGQWCNRGLYPCGGSQLLFRNARGDCSPPDGRPPVRYAKSAPLARLGPGGRVPAGLAPHRRSRF